MEAGGRHYPPYPLTFGCEPLNNVREYHSRRLDSWALRLAVAFSGT